MSTTVLDLPAPETTTERKSRVNPKKVEYLLEKVGRSLPAEVRKRDDSIAPFDLRRIESAVSRCFDACEAPVSTDPEAVTLAVANAVAARYDGGIPSVEDVQNVVEYTLQTMGEFEAARNYILYRERHARERAERPIPEEVKKAFERDTEFFPTPLQGFQFYDKYSRYNWDLGRRETWVETVDRSVEFLRELSHDKLPESVYEEIHDGILTMKVMPSMRLLAMAGPAARRNNMAIYNCSYIPISDIEAFVETLLISMAGCGVGYSVESQYVEQFPRIKRQKKNAEVPVHFVEDSTEGWGDALRVGLEAWFGGTDVEFDFSGVRDAGTILKTKGGRASGPEPFKNALQNIRRIILARQGTFLHPVDAHDIQCWIGEAAVSGGVRRTALISLYDADDHEMRNCKNGAAIGINDKRWNANNSEVWPEEFDQIYHMRHMMEMAQGRRGEPGIFSRSNATRTKPKRRKKAQFGTNPCGEIVLRPYQFCNLSIAVARPDDTEETLRNKVRLATIIGTIQSMADHFPGLRPEWKQNAEEERLLGVDINGQKDSRVAMDPGVQSRLKEYSIEINAGIADILGIAHAAAISTDKPNGNSSELLRCPPGIHDWFAEYFIRRARLAASSPLWRVMKDAGVPMFPENGQTAANATTWVLEFPVKAPEGSITRKGRTALDQLEYWLQVKENWTEHNPSCTILYRDEELLDVTKWVYEHKDVIGGLSFLPLDDAKYSLAPYEEITKEEYEERVAEFPDIDYSKIYRYELDDMTTAAQELACFAGSCAT